MAFFTITEASGEDGVEIVAVSGYLDFDAAPQLKRSVVQRIDQGTRNLVVDLSETRFIDSTAIGVLVGAVKRLREADGSLVVVCSDENVRNIFEIAGLVDVIPVYRSRDDACSSLSRAA